MKAAAKKILEEFGLLDGARRLLDPLRGLSRRLKHPFKPSDRKILANYLARNSVAKLHAGCGYYLIDGWLNADYGFKLPDVMHLDLKRRFPFADSTFDYVFNEHIIEHMTYDHGVKMLSEFFRILKQGGRARIATPDLAFVVDLTRPDKSELQRAYIKWAVDNFIPGAPDDNEAFVINNLMRNWGHTFIYDENTLRRAMTTAGFRNIERFDQLASNDPALRNLEDENHAPAKFLRLETFVLEGTK